MADEEQAASNEIGENGENDYDEAEPTASAEVIETTTLPPGEDFDTDSEPIEDYVVNLVVNEQPVIDAFVTDSQGNLIEQQSTPLMDSINGYTTAIYDELNGNSTGIATGKRWWWGWSTQKMLLVGLIALCILGIILAILFLVIGKKFRKNKRTQATGTTTTTKSVVTKGIAPDTKYEPVRAV